MLGKPELEASPDRRGMVVAGAVEKDGTVVVEKDGVGIGKGRGSGTEGSVLLSDDRARGGRGGEAQELSAVRYD